MSNLVIVAIPDENDRVWKISSEKVPHLTVLFLGDNAGDVANVAKITGFVEHAANTTLNRFYLPVDRRGVLGPDEADVLFFKKGRYDFKAIRDFRAALLQDNNIKTAYDSAQQFDGPWQPHLTLGYPATPANEDPQDYPFYEVSFNRIAVWTGDYEGTEFLLKDYWDEIDEAFDSVPMDVAMSDIRHYGVKGMRWGVRKDEGPPTSMFDPQGHDKTTDVVKAVLWPAVPPLGLFAIPAQVRLARAAGRGAKAKAIDINEKRFAAHAHSAKNFADIHNAAGPRIDREIPALNARHPGDLTKDPAKQKAYDDDVVKMLQGAYRESANSIGNKPNTMHLDVEFHNDGMDFKIAAKQGAATPIPQRVQHAASDETVELEYTGTVLRDNTGHFKGLKFNDPSKDPTVQHTADLGAEFLSHYGVKGMRWGMHRQTERSTPTPKAPSATSVVPHGDKRKTKIEATGGENHPAHEDAIKVAEAKAKLQKSGVAALSNQELRDVASRVQLEQQVTQLTASKGKKFATNLIKTQGQQELNAQFNVNRQNRLRKTAA